MAVDDSPDVGDRATPRAVGGSDPTELTDRAIAKAVAAQRDYIDGQIAVLAERMLGSTSLTDERFEAAEKLRIEQKKDTKDAVDAALSAAKEAVKEQTTASERSIDKSETATREALKQMAETFAKTTEGLSDKIDGVKERIDRIESVKLGGTENRTATYALIGAAAVIISIVVGVVSFVVANSP